MISFQSPRRYGAIYGFDTFARVRCVVRVGGQVHILAYQQPGHHASPILSLLRSLHRYSPGQRQVTAGAARNSSKLRHPLFPIIVRGDTPNGTGFVNLFGLVKATRSLFGALVHPCKKPSCRLSDSLEILSCGVRHVDEHARKERQSAVKE